MNNPVMAESSDKKQDRFLEPNINLLNRYSKLLRRYSRLVVVAIGFDFMSLIAFAFTDMHQQLDGFLNIPYRPVIVLTVLLAGFATGLLFLARFNRLRKQGMTVYENLTEDIDWSSKRREYIHRPSREARSTIRDFLHAADLPFTNGVNGQAIYILGFVAIISAAVVLLVRI